MFYVATAPRLDQMGHVARRLHWLRDSTDNEQTRACHSTLEREQWGRF